LQIRISEDGSTYMNQEVKRKKTHTIGGNAIRMKSFKEKVQKRPTTISGGKGAFVEGRNTKE